MFIKNCPCDVKTSNKLFRPWDTSGAVSDSSQDCTISTTSSEENIPSKNDNNSVSSEKLPKPKENSKKSFRPVNNTSKSVLPISEIYPVDYFHPAYPTDIIQSTMAQSMVGLPSSDPILMETITQGIAIEEYMRVLSQDQHEKLLASKKQRPKKYKCPHCDVGFSNNGQLKGHIRIHTGERPFKCEEKECGKTFTRNEELTRHKRIHSGLRPFPCAHCGKRFGRKDHLKKHSRTHFQQRGMYAVPVMLPFEAWASSGSSYPFVPMFGY